MIISNDQVQSNLRTDGQQLAEGTRLARNKNPKNVTAKGQVTISPESKKKSMAEKITDQIINQFANGSEFSDTRQEILNQLSGKFGYYNKTQRKEGQRLTVKVPDGESKDGDQNLSPEQTED